MLSLPISSDVVEVTMILSLTGQASIVLKRRELIINDCKDMLAKDSNGIPLTQQEEIITAMESLIDVVTVQQQESICQQCQKAWGFLLLTPCCHLYW